MAVFSTFMINLRCFWLKPFGVLRKGAFSKIYYKKQNKTGLIVWGKKCYICGLYVYTNALLCVCVCVKIKRKCIYIYI